jgi:hypothetical protein
VPDPVCFAAEAIDVSGRVIVAISASPVLDDATDWMITRSDAIGGFARAETEVGVPGGFLRRTTTRTDGAIELAERIMHVLRERYGSNGGARPAPWRCRARPAVSTVRALRRRVGSYARSQRFAARSRKRRPP